MPTTSSGTAYSLKGLENASVVTLIHGLGVNRLMWEPFETALANQHRVLSYDILGHGESRRPDEPLSLQLLSNQLRELLMKSESIVAQSSGFLWAELSIVDLLWAILKEPVRC